MPGLHFFSTFQQKLENTIHFSLRLHALGNTVGEWVKNGVESVGARKVEGAESRGKEKMEEKLEKRRKQSIQAIKERKCAYRGHFPTLFGLLCLSYIEIYN